MVEADGPVGWRHRFILKHQAHQNGQLAEGRATIWTGRFANRRALGLWFSFLLLCVARSFPFLVFCVEEGIHPCLIFESAVLGGLRRVERLDTIGRGHVRETSVRAAVHEGLQPTDDDSVGIYKTVQVVDMSFL
jgi:hypothetical protein